MAAALGLLVALPVACKGRGATGGCGESDSECGGNPVGLWTVTEVCSFPVTSRPAQNYDTSRGYFQPETGAAPPAMASGPWCWDLAFDKDGNITSPATPMPNPDRVISGTVEFKEDHGYVYTLTATSQTKFHVAKSCFGVYSATLTCAGFAAKLATSVIGNNPAYSNPVMGQPAFACADQGDGCDCTFDYLEADSNNAAVGDKGTWAQDGNILHHYSITGQGNLFETSPTRRTVRDASFCQTGDTMVLSGANGAPLALKTGTRTLYLNRVPPAPTTGAAGSGGGEAGNGGAAGSNGAAGVSGTGTAGAGGDDGGAQGDAATD